MESFLKIFEDQKMILPNAQALRQVQELNDPRSIAFLLDDSSVNFLKSTLPFDTTKEQYQPTIKKIAENILLLNQDIDPDSGRSQMARINSQS